jgi:hypothetical protein
LDRYATQQLDQKHERLTNRHPDRTKRAVVLEAVKVWPGKGGVRRKVDCGNETSARVKGKTHWQWAFGWATAVYHVIAPTRGKCVPTDFLAGVRPKVWLSDRRPERTRRHLRRSASHCARAHRGGIRWIGVSPGSAATRYRAR